MDTGSHETHDGPLCTSKSSHFGPADTLHVSGPWPKATSSLHALRDRGVMATPFQTAERRNTIHHGLKIPYICNAIPVCVYHALS